MSLLGCWPEVYPGIWEPLLYLVYAFLGDGSAFEIELFWSSVAA
jgi:hypothetical protein